MPPPFEVYMLLKDPKKLRKLMIIQDVSARQLAKAAGYSAHSYVQRLLKGTAKWVDVEPAVRMATFLGVDVADIFVPKTSSDGSQGAKRRQRVAA